MNLKINCSLKILMTIPPYPCPLYIIHYIMIMHAEIRKRDDDDESSSESGASAEQKLPELPDHISSRDGQ